MSHKSAKLIRKFCRLMFLAAIPFDEGKIRKEHQKNPKLPLIEVLRRTTKGGRE